MGETKRMVAVTFFLFHLAICSVGANAASSGFADDGDPSAAAEPGGSEAAPPARDRDAAVAVPSPRAVTRAAQPTKACLKEGEPCNTLNDKCCAGYYCFGGLIPTCFRKP